MQALVGVVPAGAVWGTTGSAGDCACWWVLAGASAGPAQGLYGRCRNVVEVHGKEKVYGSIP